MNKIRNMKKVPALVLLSMIIVIASVIISSADSSLLSVGSNTQVIAGSSFEFSLDLSSFAPTEEEAASTFDYVVALSVSGDISELSVTEGVGNYNAVSGEYEVNYTELDGDNKLNFIVTPSEDITEETTYTVSVNITGNRTGSDSFSFIVIPVSTEEDSSESTEDTSSESTGDQSSNNRNGSMKQSAGKQSGKSKSGSAGGSVKSSSSSGSSSSSSSVTYAGSWDNYLDELSVDGYEFTQKFNKIRDTYFLTVPDSITSLTVNATASDSSASVDIAGDSELSGKRSKVMVNVTADDGSVRVYRIYVYRLSEEEIAAAEEAEQAEAEAAERKTFGDGERPEMGEGFDGMPGGFESNGDKDITEAEREESND